MPTLVLSDIHAGGPASLIVSAGQLTPLFEGFDRIIYNGDCAEFCWLGGDRPPEQWVDELSAAAAGNGREVIWIRGNHDLPIDGLDLFHDDGVLYTHGHGFSGRGRSLPVEAHFERVRRRHERGLCRRRRFPRAWRVCNAMVRMVPGHMPGRVRFLFGMRRKVARFVDAYAQAPLRAVVIGHHHFTRTFDLPGGVTLYQGGAWYRRTRPSVVVVDGDAIDLHWVRRAGDRFALGDPAVRGARSPGISA